MTENIESTPDLSFEAWMRIGLRKGWAGSPICYTHDGLPLSSEEETEFEESDPCIHIIRLYDDPEHKTAVEDNHGPSVWRTTNQGITVDGEDRTDI